MENAARESDARWLTRFDRLSEVAGFRQSLGEAARHASFDLFHFTFFSAGRGEFSLSDCPEEWASEWARRGALHDEPPIVHALERVRPTCWSELRGHDPAWFSTTRS